MSFLQKNTFHLKSDVDKNGETIYIISTVGHWYGICKKELSSWYADYSKHLKGFSDFLHTYQTRLQI